MKARDDIQSRIEILQKDAVPNYGGGIPEPGMIIEKLTEKLKKIDAALSTSARQVPMPDLQQEPPMSRMSHMSHMGH